MPGEIARTTGRAGVAVPAPSGQAQVTPMQQAAQQYEHSLQAKLAYAQFLADSNLLPRAYQNRPSNILWALEYGQALGISPIAVMMGVWIDPSGTPAASAGLMQALVRMQGHKLRLSAAPDGKSATCVIIRKDDPDNPTTVTYTWDMAITAKLTGKKNWQENPVAMLKARATAACARDACQEVLLGLYTPDELGAEVADDETPPAGYVPGRPQRAAEPAEQGPESPASQERIRAVVEAFRALGLRDITSIKDAVQIMVRREEDNPLGDPPNLTVEECQFIMDELTGIEDLTALQSYLSDAMDTEPADAE